jgi:hypothetical protein
MHVYEADIWTSVYHNEVFSHTNKRVQLIHALNEERARKQITLAPESIWTAPDGKLTIRSRAEYIYHLKKTGTVTKQLFYVYSDGRQPRPVKTPSVKRQRAQRQDSGRRVGKTEEELNQLRDKVEAT